MLLARSLFWKGSRYPMANVFPFNVEVCVAPQGHGYSEVHVDAPNPFFPAGAILRGHEFHYSRIAGCDNPVYTAGFVVRGSGCFPGRDFVVSHNVMASYMHLHALATSEWATGFLSAARRFSTHSQLRVRK